MHSAIQDHPISRISWRAFSIWSAVLLILAAVPAVWLLISGRTIMAAAYCTIPFIVFFISSPRYSFYLFLALNFIYAPYYLTGMAIHPWDLAALLFAAAAFVSWMLKYSSTMDKTSLDYYLLFLILATAFSAFFAYRPALSIVPTVRIILVFVIFRAIYYLSGRMSPSKMIQFFIHAYTLVSLYNCLVFFSHGGGIRIFGFSGIAFETFCMVGVPVSLAYAIWHPRNSGRVFYSFLFLINLIATVATGSRGPLLTIGIAIPVLLLASYIKARKTGCSYARKYVHGFVIILIPVVLALIISSGYFLLVGERFEELGAEQPKGTILLRLSLWKAAIEGFLLDPITGIGIGNFRVIDDLLTHLKFDAVRYYLIGLSFHNVFLQYLAETGIPGALAILLLGWNALKIGRRVFLFNGKTEDLPLAASLFISAFVFFITIFYMRAWTWGQEGYVLALILALLARSYRPTQTAGG
ncbi:MAG: O-antigen ligase family protein [Candidatus Zixiibacteriota bacterium]